MAARMLASTRVAIAVMRVPMRASCRQTQEAAFLCGPGADSTSYASSIPTASRMTSTGQRVLPVPT